MASRLYDSKKTGEEETRDEISQPLPPSRKSRSPPARYPPASIDKGSKESQSRENDPQKENTPAEIQADVSSSKVDGSTVVSEPRDSMLDHKNAPDGAVPSSNGRRRRSGNFRNQEPGAFAVGPMDDGNGTVAIESGEAGEENMAPLDASLAPERRNKYDMVEARRWPQHRIRNSLIVLLGLFVVVGLVFGLLIGLKESKTHVDTTLTRPSGTGGNSFEWIEDSINSTSSGLSEFMVGDGRMDLLGWSLAISEDASTVVAGALELGTAAPSGYIRTSLWSSGDQEWQRFGIDVLGGLGERGMGHRVAVSENGAILAGGSLVGGGVRVFERGNRMWTQRGLGTIDVHPSNTSDRTTLHDLSLSADGNILAVSGGSHLEVQGSYTTFASYVKVLRYDQQSRTWSSLGRPLLGETDLWDVYAGLFLPNSTRDAFGYSISLSAVGDRLAVGIPGGSTIHGIHSGSVQVFELDDDGWVPLGTEVIGLGEFDAFGHSVSLSSDGSCVAAGAPQQAALLDFEFEAPGSRPGYVRVHSYQDGQWVPRGEILPGHSSAVKFGFDVDLSGDGLTVVVGSPNLLGNNSYAGRATVFRYESNSWAPLADFDGSRLHESLGTSVALSRNGSVMVAGGPGADLGEGFEGIVRVFREVQVH